MRNIFGERVREIRESFGFSLQDLSERSGVSKAYLWQIENNNSRKRIGLDIAMKIASALCISISGLIDGKVYKTCPMCMGRGKIIDR